MTGVTLWQWQNSAISEINAFRSSAETFLTSNHQFDALIASIKAGRQLKRTFGVDANTQIQVVETLQGVLRFVRERNRLEGHDDAVTSVSFSPDGQTIATASYDNTVKIWSQNGLLLQTLKGHSDRVTSVSFSSNGNLIATASYDKTVKLWSRDGKLLQTLKGHKDRVTSVTFSPSGNEVATASEDKIAIVWNLYLENLDQLLVHTCDWVGDYLNTNPNVSKSDRHLCDGIKVH